MKKYIQVSEYMNARRRYLQMVNRYKKQGYYISDYFKPSIPKRPTEGSIRRLNNLATKLKESVHEQRVETGYYVRQREQRAIQAKIRKAAKKKPKATTKKYKKSKFKIPTKIPKVVKNKQSQPPNLSDATLRSFESEMAIARNYVSRSMPFQNAVNEAGLDAQYEFDRKIDELINKYLPDITKHEVRVEVSKKLAENFANYMSDIESYLYEFISDGQGHLNHTETGLRALEDIIEAMSGAEISIEEKKQLEELANSIDDGDLMEGVDDEYDY